MASTTESLLKVELMADGEKSNTWGQILNTVISLLAESVAGLESVATTGGSTVLSDTEWASNQARNAILKFTGVLASNAEIVVPTRSKPYIVWNATTGDYTLTVKTAAGTGIVVPQGVKLLLICDGTNVLDMFSGLLKQGKQMFHIPAQAWVPAETNGATAFDTLEVSAGTVMAKHLSFNKSTQQYAEFSMCLPKQWNNSTITFQAVWTTSADTSTNAVIWELSATSAADNDAVNPAFGTAIPVTDNNQGASARTLISAESAAVTIAGSPASGEYQTFRISRKAADAGDTLDASALLLGVNIFITTNAANDA
ncbi:MAG: hypothetical protein ACXWYM_00265 [Candidatus Binatia bacterium]